MRMLSAFDVGQKRGKWLMRHLLPSQTHCLRIQDVINLILFLLLSLLTDKKT